MGYPTTYSWILASPPTGSGVPPVTSSAPSPARGAFSAHTTNKQFVRGLRFANVVGGDAKNVIHGGARVWHVNSLQNVQMPTMDQFDLTGVIKNRFRKNVFQQVPVAVRHWAPNSVDRFGNPVFPFTGTGSL